MITVVVVLLTLAVGTLGVLFFFLNKRVETMVERLRIVYANLDVVHKNQEELLAQNLRMFHAHRKEIESKK